MIFLKNNSKILTLLKSDASIELAFQLILTQKIGFNKEISQELRKHPYLCIKYGLETAYISQLKKLYLTRLQLNEFPSEILPIQGLTQLNLAHNQLDKLPPDIARFTQLEVLNLSANQFSVFPMEVLKLTKLKVLYLGNNQLQCLPAEIKQLSNLIALDLSHNPLGGMPKLESLPKLKELVYQGNLMSKGALAMVRQYLPNCEVYT
ncbi:leucine-rich repeat domain-containing protein [Microscilla marina]|uniref:Leucine-rich repeat containing protein n=1 Tax=Microscilla marina ATCC 23134 TaxID=313606 RepID=A1ZFE8_MICM2|nr:leucine-rich repeat domain-containing protein [Microscilla marina]EAY30722.1 leucine-rich repeat containing protein [Microscilla marina ATCC 23134]